MKGKLSKSAFSEGVRHFERQFQEDGDVACNRSMDRWIREWWFLSYGEKIAEKFNRLSRVHQRHRQSTDRQTDGSATAYSEREREFTSAKK